MHTDHLREQTVPRAITCPVDDCDAGPWADTYGADGGRRARFQHVYDAHADGRGLPCKLLGGDA